MFLYTHFRPDDFSSSETEIGLSCSLLPVSRGNRFGANVWSTTNSESNTMGMVKNKKCIIMWAR